MSQHEFMTGVRQLREWSAQPQQAKQYSSHVQMVADKKQHRRVEWEAQKALQEPVTAAQTVSVYMCGRLPGSHDGTSITHQHSSLSQWVPALKPQNQVAGW